jgi:hypothetical protein
MIETCTALHKKVLRAVEFVWISKCVCWRYNPHVQIILDMNLSLSKRDIIQRYGKEFVLT